MTTCPVCGKTIDPIRAPAVAVREGRVVSYCSKDCAALESGPTKLIPTKVMRMPSNDPVTGEPVRITGRQAAVRPTSTTPSGGVVTASAPDEDSAPVIEISREPSRPVVEPVRPARHKRPDSVQIADTGHLDDYVTPDAPRRRGLWLAVALLVIAGSSAAAYFLGYFDTLLGRDAPVATVATPSDAAVVAPVIDDAAPPITREVAMAQAQSALRTQLTAVPRVQQLAASALARTGDKGAIDTLAAALATERSDLTKVELAYALARADDKRGFDALMAAASPQKRDARHEAGRRLALLGDKRAINVLQSSLNYPQFRLGVAEQLAYLAEPRALAVLDAVRADAKALPDEKARAAIALGWAGRADIAPALRELLADDRNNAYAAHALANLRDESARPVLEKQLELSSLRVQAARALRRMRPDADVSDLLPPLVTALATENRDTAQIELAEAILLLAGPAAWSERE